LSEGVCIYYSLLLINNLKIKSNIKFFLIKWIDVFGIKNAIELSIVRISERLGLPVSSVTKSLTYLVENGLFEKELIFKTNKWSRYSYSTTVKLTRDLLHGDDPEKISQLGLVRNLLQPDVGLNCRNHKYHPVTIPDRLLLIILLYHSNSCGVVDCLSLNDLAHLTRLTKSSIKSRITCLKRKGYIRSYISGVNGKCLFKHKNGIFILNLKHPNFSSDSVNGFTLLFQSTTYTETSLGNNIAEANEIYSAANFLLKPAKENYTSFKYINLFKNNCDRLCFSEYFNEFIHIVPFFNEHPFTAKMQNFLQAKINQYASTLLSRYWQQLVSEETNYEDKLKKIIRQDSLGDLIMPDENTYEFPNRENICLLVNFIYDAACFLAKRIQTQLKCVERYPLAGMDFIIIPSVDDFRVYLAVEAFYKTPSAPSNKTNIVIKILADYTNPTRTIIDEKYKLTKDDEFMYGLLSKLEAKIYPTKNKNCQK